MMKKMDFLPVDGEQSPLKHGDTGEVILIYVGDCLIAAKTKEMISDIYQELHGKGLRLEKSGTCQRIPGIPSHPS